ncbi:MAG: class II glutamine amidotransferase [Gemmatimonadota bacterium]|jgi:glutamine amidotransferase
MCRVVAYLGTPLLLDVLLYRSESALVRQAYDPSMLTFMNLAGFGFAAWDSGSHDPEVPFLYKDTMLPMYDRNLMQMSRKLRSECLIAHVRGENYFGGATPRVGRANLHPFQHHGSRVVMAHNGGLNRFAEMRYDLLPYLSADAAERIEGTTDSEWIYALLLSRLAARRKGDGAGAATGAEPGAQGDATGPDALADAVEDTLRIIRDVREERGIHFASGVNLFVSDGRSLVATRFSFDFGCFEGPVRARHLAYHSLWLTAGRSYGLHEGEWRMQGKMEEADSVLVASEPLTRDVSTWIEIPEYTLLVAHRVGRQLELDARDLDV